MIELYLCLIAGAVGFFFRWLQKQAYRVSATLFFLGALLGLAAQWLLGRDLNQYTSNVSLYIGPVCIAVVLSWGIGLLSVYSLAARWSLRFRTRPSPVLHALVAIPLIVFIEILGSHLVRFKLNAYEQYRPLIPFLQIMHAPAWLYGYYFIVNLLFFYLIRWSGIERRRFPPANGTLASLSPFWFSRRPQDS